MTQHQRLLSTALLVATLGYFVDVYDLVLFIVLKNPSLKELGVPKEQFIDTGAALLNTQMIGMLVGGVVWGLLGDKIGRTRVLFGSIAIYSLANILNGFIESLPSYYVLRALAGFGLAGELGECLHLGMCNLLHVEAIEDGRSNLPHLERRFVSPVLQRCSVSHRLERSQNAVGIALDYAECGRHFGDTCRRFAPTQPLQCTQRLD